MGACVCSDSDSDSDSDNEALRAKNAAQKTRRTTRVLAQEFAHITIKKALTALYSGGNFRGVGLGVCDNQAVP